MKVQIQSVNFEAGRDLINVVNDKVSKLDKFFDSILSAEVILKEENSSEPTNKNSEIRLIIPGDDLFASKIADSYEMATEQVVEALKRQLVKRKEKLKG